MGLEDCGVVGIVGVVDSIGEASKITISKMYGYLASLSIYRENT